MGKKLDKARGLAVSAVKSASKATKKATRATGKAARKAARETGHAAKVCGEILAAAILGNEAERMLAIGSHDVVRDVQLAGKEGGEARPENVHRHEGEFRDGNKYGICSCLRQFHGRRLHGIDRRRDHV